MAYLIQAELCTGCGACESECPNKAITHKGKVFKINAAKCKECEGSFDAPQCVELCQPAAVVHID